MAQHAHHDHSHDMHDHGPGDAAHHHAHEFRPQHRRALLILRSTWSLVRESVGLLMEVVPEGVDYRVAGKMPAGIDGGKWCA